MANTFIAEGFLNTVVVDVSKPWVVEIRLRWSPTMGGKQIFYEAFASREEARARLRQVSEERVKYAELQLAVDIRDYFNGDAGEIFTHERLSVEAYIRPMSMQEAEAVPENVYAKSSLFDQRCSDSRKASWVEEAHNATIENNVVSGCQYDPMTVEYYVLRSPSYIYDANNSPAV